MKNYKDTASRSKKRRSALKTSKGLAKFHMKKPDKTLQELEKEEKERAEKELKVKDAVTFS